MARSTSAVVAAKFKAADDAMRTLTVATHNFKPVFGKQKHLMLLASLKRVGADYAELNVKREKRSGGEKLAEDITRSAGSLINQIARIKDEQPSEVSDN